MLFHIGAKLWIWDDTIRYLDVGPLVGWLGGVCFCVQWCRCFTWFVGLFSFVCMRLGCRSTFRDYDTLQCKWHAASWTCTRYETTMNAGWSHHRMAGSQPEYDFSHWIFIWKAKNFWFFSLFHFGYTSCGIGTWCKFTNIRKKLTLSSYQNALSWISGFYVQITITHIHKLTEWRVFQSQWLDK